MTMNIQNVQNQIAIKKGSDPYLATVKQSSQVITDYDSFPYNRYFRGIPESTIPIVAEREAGWRTRDDSCYKPEKCNGDCVSIYPLHYFQPACSTVLPCYSGKLCVKCISLYR